MINFDRVNEATLAAFPGLLEQWLPGGRYEGAEYVTRNPTRADNRPGSFKVNVTSGKWADFATSDAGGDPISLYAYLQGGLPQSEAARQLAEELKVTSHRKVSARATGAARRARTFTALPCPPDRVLAPDFKHHQLGRPSATWTYRDRECRPLFYVARFDGPDGKQVLPLSWCRADDGTEAWQWRAPSDPRPLFNLDRIAADPEAPVLVVEGEKVADAAGALGYLATTSQGGSKAAAKSDWSTLAARDVVIWPDNDDAGRRYAEMVAELATGAGAASVHIVQVPDHFADGWDLADQKLDSAELNTLLVNSQALEPPPAKPEIETQSQFRVGPDGVFIEVEDKTGETDWKRVCSEIRVVACTRNTSGEAWGRLLLVRDRDGTVHEWAMPMGMMAGDGTAYRERLLDLGAELAPGKPGRDRLHLYLSTWKPRERARCVERVGWHEKLFVLPDLTIGASGEERVLLQVAGVAPQFDVAGTLEGWQAEIGALAVGNSRMVLAISAAFAAALLHPAAEESGGVHLYGQSSSGKTTIGLCAASVWGVPRRTWRTTANAAEAVARGCCDALLLLDEIGQAAGPEIDALAYLFGNEVGKSRMKRDATARETLTWRTLFISTGEVGLSAKLSETGRRAKAGQAMRLVEIPADAGAGHGCFEELHGHANGDALARELKRAADRHKGQAARAFIERVTAEFEDVAATVVAFRERWVAEALPPGADAQARRAAGRFALIAAAGELAQDCGIVPWPEREAERAARRCFEAWLEQRGGSDPHEIIEGLNQIRQFLEQHGNDRFERAWNIRHDRDCQEIPDRIVNRAGFRRLTEEDRWEYYILPEVWKNEVCRGFDHVMLARVMVERGWMKPGEGRNLASKVDIPRNGKLRVYRILPAFLET